MNSRQEMLQIIADRQKNDMQAHRDRMTSSQSIPGPKSYLELVEQYMKDHPEISKAQAMRAITAKYPEKHEAWIRQVNQR